MDVCFNYLRDDTDKIYFPYTRIDGILDIDNKPFTDWITMVNFHNHDDKYATISHSHDTVYSRLNHNHEGYAIINHVHKYAAADNPGGSALSAERLDTPVTCVIEGLYRPDEYDNSSFFVIGTDEPTELNKINLAHIHPEYININSTNTLVGTAYERTSFGLLGSNTIISLNCTDDTGIISINNTNGGNIADIIVIDNRDGTQTLQVNMNHNNLITITNTNTVQTCAPDVAGEELTDSDAPIKPTVYVNAHVIVNGLTDLSKDNI